MICTIGEHKWSAAVANSLGNIRDDLLVSLLVGHQCGIGVVNSEIRDLGWHPETCVPRQYQVAKGRALSGVTGTHVESNGSALHENDRVMPVLSSRSRGQADDKLRFDLPHDLFATEGA